MENRNGISLGCRYETNATTLRACLRLNNGMIRGALLPTVHSDWNAGETLHMAVT